MSAVYSLRSYKLDNFIVTKFDDDFNIESYYEMTVADGVVRCGCPAGVRPMCRHRQMFAELLTRLDTAWFLDFDTRQWVDPTGEAASAESSLEVPVGVTVVELNDPGSMHNAIAEGIGEPTIKYELPHPFRRRM